MIEWEYFARETGLQQHSRAKPRDTVVSVWHAFMPDGTVTSWDTSPEAFRVSNDVKEHKFRSAEFREWQQRRAALVKETFERWRRAVRAEYPDLTDAAFEVCYNRAYSNQIGRGHDAVADNLEDIAEMAMSFLAAMNPPESAAMPSTYAETKTAWVAYTNTDLNDGCGIDVPIAVCEMQETAQRLAQEKYVQGTNGPVRPITLAKVDGKWYALGNAVSVVPPAAEDIAAQIDADCAVK